LSAYIFKSPAGKFIKIRINLIIPYIIYFVLFKITVTGINKTKPEAEKMVFQIIKSFFGFIRILFCNRYLSLYDIQFIDNNNGWIAGAGGTILKTTNGGTNWTQVNNVTQNNLYSLYFVNYTTGYAAGVGGTIIKTTNGGNNWSI